MKSDIKLVVTGIISDPIDGYVKVRIARGIFDMLRVIKPKVIFDTLSDKAGNGVRVFHFANEDLYSKYNTETGGTTYIMKEADAIECNSGEEVNLEFDASLFENVQTNNSSVATA